MSRSQSDGLAYFPLDVGFFKDPRIRRLTKRFGGDGPAFYLYTLCAIYGGSGYYIVKDKDFIEDAAIDLECTIEKIGLMLEYLLDRSLLKDIPSCMVNYLTSHGIQAQYQRSIKGRKRNVVVDAALWILNESETEGFVQVRQNENNSRIYQINPGEKPINQGIMPQSKVKESKVKESKVKESKVDGGRARAREDELRRLLIPSREEVRAFAKERRSKADPDRFYDWYEAGKWRDANGELVRNWKQKFMTWERLDSTESASEGAGNKNLTFYDVAQQMKARGEF